MRILSACFLAVFASLSFSAAVLAGQRAAPSLPPPQPGTDASEHLAIDWKKSVYDALTARMGDKQKSVTKYVFLDPPVPCTVRQHHMLKIFGKGREWTGYGGLVAMRQDKLLFDYDWLILYVIDAEGNLVYKLNFQEFNKVVVEPALYEATVKTTSRSTELRVMPKASPQALVRMALFRKAPLANLPPYL